MEEIRSSLTTGGAYTSVHVVKPLALFRGCPCDRTGNERQNFVSVKEDVDLQEMQGLDDW